MRRLQEKCFENCPTGLGVKNMVRRRIMDNTECILCGACVDACPKGATHML
ncbi:MAG TPA: 4Fe-4S binding protein [Methanothrix sp.]|nr:4Fe-4S binding protein [Methanothrix sp.]HPJ84282.1 4Fe-4S binding protein [Methanothrix sp.]HPR66754.1 4Fe-4S binding protein [Methanothrix sp.]